MNKKESCSVKGDGGRKYKDEGGKRMRSKEEEKGRNEDDGR